MAEARRSEQYDHTALLAMLIVNWSGYAKRPAKVADYHPFLRGSRPAGVRIHAGNIHLLVKAFCGSGRRKKHERNTDA
jgi:hypothetical protein